MLRPKAFYFFFFSAIAALSPFLILYYESLNFSGQQIGVLSALSPLMMLAGAPLWGMVADATGRHKTVLVSLMGLSLVAVLALSLANTFGALLLLVASYTFLIAPVIPLGDTAVLKLLGDQKRNYGRVRVWGAVGFGASAPIVGWLVERFDLSWAFYLYIFFMALCMLACLGLPVTTKTDKFQASSLTDFLSAPWLFLFAAVFLGGAGLAVSGNFVYLYLAELKAAGLIVGLALTFAVVSEVPLTFYGKQLLERFSTQHLLIASLLFLALRLFLYSLFNSPALILLVQLLHGFCFAIMWIAAVSYADEFAPEGKTATAQGLLGAVMMGLGSTTGGLLGGYLYDALGASIMFRVLAGALLLAALLLFMGLHRFVPKVRAS